jgi:hypothetical protein
MNATSPSVIFRLGSRYGLRIGLGVTEAQLMEAVHVLRLADDLHVVFTAQDRVTLGTSWQSRCEALTGRA